MPCSQKRRAASGFTLIELLVVIAIIAIIAAILFPVFQKVRENARRAGCASNEKQFVLGILMYVNDSDEALPLTYQDTYSYGPGTVVYNTGPNVVGSNIGGTNPGGVLTGIPAEIQPYVKSTQVFDCPDDHAIVSGEIAAKNLPFGNGTLSAAESAAVIKMTYYQIYGTAYKFTNQNYSRPVATVGKTYTGYTQVPVCATAGATKCEFLAQGEKFTPVVSGSNINFPGTAAETGTGYGYSVTTLNMFTRPTETRMFADWQKNYIDKPTAYAFHPTGFNAAYEDGHVKWVQQYSAERTGCDGLDWAWDQAGSCNINGYQRQAD